MSPLEDLKSYGELAWTLKLDIAQLKLLINDVLLNIVQIIILIVIAILILSILLQGAEELVKTGINPDNFTEV